MLSATKRTAETAMAELGTQHKLAILGATESKTVAFASAIA
jgi:hypothetical protein